MCYLTFPKTQVKGHLETAIPPLPLSGCWHWPLNSVPGRICSLAFLNFIIYFQTWNIKTSLPPVLVFVCLLFFFWIQISKSFSRLEKGRAKGGMKSSMGISCHRRGQLSPICLGKMSGELLVMSSAHKQAGLAGLQSATSQKWDPGHTHSSTPPPLLHSRRNKTRQERMKN